MAKGAKQRKRGKRKARIAGRHPELEPLIDEAVNEVKHGNFQRAAGLSRRALKRAPGSVDAMSTLGLALKGLGDLEGARVCLEKAVAAKPEGAAGHRNLAWVLTSLCRFEEAHASFRRAIESDPLQPGTYVDLGTLLMNIGKFSEAETALRRAIEIDPEEARAHVNLCWVLRRLDRLKEAIESGRRGVALQPNELAHNYLAFALLANDDCQAALEICDASLRINPLNTSALAFKVSALDGVGRREEGRALADIEKLLWTAMLKAPGDYENLSTFNSALAHHVLNFPTRPFDPTQTLELFADPQGPVLSMQTVINEALAHYSDWLPVDSRHPFLSYKPGKWKLNGWATRMRAQTPQEHHFHHHGWISGVYYVQVPEVMSPDNSALSGHIEFCRFQQYSNRPVDSELMAIRPEAGFMVLFPSYFYHRISPFNASTPRISIAFNVIPQDPQYRVSEGPELLLNMA